MHIMQAPSSPSQGSHTISGLSGAPQSRKTVFQRFMRAPAVNSHQRCVFHGAHIMHDAPCAGSAAVQGIAIKLIICHASVAVSLAPPCKPSALRCVCPCCMFLIAGPSSSGYQTPAMQEMTRHHTAAPSCDASTSSQHHGTPGQSLLQVTAADVPIGVFASMGQAINTMATPPQSSRLAVLVQQQVGLLRQCVLQSLQPLHARSIAQGLR